MKKFAIALLTILSIISVSCQIGLGAAVDTEPPALTIQNPPIDSVIRDDFAIVGTYSDDGKIESVVAQVERTDGSGYSETFTGVLNGKIKARTEGTYTIVIPAKTSKITDGSYQAIVTIKDETGRTTIRNTTFTIDNTPPVIVLQRPGTDINATLSNADTYGQLFTLEGLGADDSNIDHINVDIYGDKAKTDYKTTVTLNNVPPSISLDVAKYGDEAYKKIYGDVAPADFIPQQYYCSITAFDGAQRYPADGSEQTAADLLGNPTSDYYIYEEISNSVLKQAKVTDIYHILNGSFGLDSSRSSGIDTAAILDTLALKKKTVGSFVLDPKNNPTYSIAGKPTLIAGENAECLKLDSDYTVSNDSDITVQVNIGLDNSPIVNDENFKVYFQKCKFENGKYVGYGDLIEAPVVANGKKKIGSNYQFTVNVKSSANGLEVEKPYLVIVNGKDENNQPIVAANNGYGFYLVSLSSAPTLKNIIPSDATVYVKEDGSLTIQGVTRLTEGKPVVSIRYGEIEWDSKTVTDADLVDGKTDEYNFEFTIPNSTFKTKAERKADGTSPASTEFALEIRSSNGEDKSTSTYKTVYFDVDNPEVNEVSIAPEINTTEPLLLNGEISVTGLVEDIFSGVKGWKYQVWKKNANEPSRESAFQTQSRVSFTYDTTLIEDLSEIDIKILAEDKAGNEYPKVIACKIDQSTDKPKFEAQDGVTWEAGILNPYYINAHAADVQSKNIISGGISSKITDDDSVAYVLFEVQAVKPKTEVSEENKADPAYVGYDADATATANLESSERYALYKKTGKEVSVTHKMPGTTGFYFITQTAYDKNFKFGADLSTLQESEIRTAITTAEANAENKNYFTKKTYVVKIPGTGPQYTLTQDTKYVSEYQRDNSKTVKVTINIENGEAPYTFKRNGEAITLTKINDNTYEDEIPVSLIYKADGDIVVTYAITDANDTTKKTIQYYRDNVKPTFTKSKIEPNTDDYSVFKKLDYYYLNNEKQKFTVSGQASDSVSGVETIKLEIINVDASGNKINSSRVITDSNKTGFFDEIEFANYEYKEDGTTIKKRNYWQYGAKITVTVTDAAGNVSDETVFNVKFDTQGPNGVHEFDQKRKDLYFRFGEANRAEDDGKTGNTWAPAWDDGLDKDVGGKYSQDTYGKLKTLQIRGLFEDDGSGVSLIYYTIFDHEPSSSEISSFEENYATEKKGYFSVRSTPETKRVFYTDKTTGNKTYKNIDSNYKETISGLDNEMNYLVFVAVDNVGNAAVEDVLFNENHYHDYKLNVDQTSPTITSNENATIYVNGETAKTISGRYTDMGSWLDTKKNKMTISFESETIDTTPISDTISNVTVTKNAEDNGGTISSLTLKEDKYDYLRENARIKIGDNYYFVSDYNEASRKSSGTIKFTPKFTGTDVEDKVEFGAGIWKAEIPAATLKSYSGNTLSVYATAYDNAGDGNQTIALNMAKIIVDREYPKAEIESLNSTINNTVPLRITTNDNNGIKHIELQYKKKSETAESAWKNYDEITASDSVTITNPFTWEITLNTNDTTKFADETEYDFRAVATDLADNIGNSGSSRDATTPEAMSASKTKTALISQDSDRPIVKFRNLELPTIPGGIIPCPLEELSFTITDDDGTITADDIEYQFTAATETTPDSTKWIGKTTDGNKLIYENGLFKLKDISDGEKYLWLKITDKANTTFTSDASSNANQNSPKITGSNDFVYSTNTALHLKVDINPPSVAKTSYLLVTGAASYTEQNWKEKSATTPVFGGPDTMHKNTFRVSLYAFDINNITSVKLVIPQETGDKNTPVYEYSFDKATTTTLGLSATDTTIDENTYDLWVSPEINVKDFATSVRTCKITVTEGVNPKIIDFSINIDNDAPHLQGTISPEANEPKVGAVIKVKGEVSDNEKGIGVNASGLKYYIPKASETTPSESTGWISLGDGAGTSTWKFELKNLNTTIGYNNETETVSGDYSSYGSGLDGLYLLPVWFRLEDTYGNVTYDRTKIKILYNPNADKPTVRITDPVHDTPKENPAYVIAGGKLKISGTASDDTGISAVYLQFDMDGNGTYENGVGVTGAPDLTLENIPNKKEGNTQLQGVKAKGTESWSCEVNLMNLENLNTASKHLKIRAIAIDKGHDSGSDLYSAWSTVLDVYVDNLKPQFSTPELRRYDSQITEGTAATKADAYNTRKDYKKDMYIRTKKSETDDLYWYIYGEALVKTGNYITELNVSSSDADGVWKGAEGNKTERSGDIFTWSEDGGLTHKYLIPVVRNNRDAWETTLTAKGNNFNDNKNENEYVFNINIDNDAPAFSDTNSTNADTLGDIKLYKNSYGGSTFDAGSTGERNLKNSDGFVTIAGKVQETGSGFARLAFYFIRKDKDNADSKRVYNIMEPHTSGTNIRTNNRTDIVASQSAGSVNLNEENLPALYITGATRSSETTISAAAINGNKNIRVGGLIKIGGEYRNITKVQGNEVTFDSNCPTSFKTAEFIYAMVVDHTGESFNNDKTAIVDDDYDGTDAYSKGDGMLEKYKSEGDDYEWEATINSKAIPDGPIEIHCVVFDKAGNIKSGWTKTYVSNNPPRLTSVMLGTDLNSDGNYTLGENNEFQQYWVNSTTSNGVVSHDTTKGTTNAWWSIDAFLPDSTDYWTAKKDLVVIPEFVGGTGDVYYKYTKATGSNGEKLQAAQQLTRNNAGTITDGAVLLASDSHILAADGSQTTLAPSQSGNIIGAIILKNDNNANSDGLGKISTVTGDYSSGSNEGINVYRFSFWDSTEECTAGSDSQWTVLNVTLKQDLADNTPPTGTITPFYWRKENGQIRSSVVYDASNVAQGHIELENDWINSDYYKGLEASARTGEFDEDPKVSGKIKIEGNASDETMLKTIKVTFDNKSVIATYNPYAKTENGVTTPKGWSYTTNTADFTLAISDANGPTQEGHSVTWVYTVDTSKASAVAAVNSVIKVEVADTSSANSGAGNSNTVGNNSTSASALTAYYKVDVVPYITGIKTELSAGSNKRPTVLSRSALGVYPVRRGSNITVEGFNLNGTNSRVLVDATEYTPTTGTTTNSLVISTDANTTSKGVSAKTGTVTSLNNLTLKTVDYNKEGNGQNNDNLTDKRELKVVDVTTTTDTTDKRMLDMAMYNNTINFASGYGPDNYATMMNATGTGIGTVKSIRNSYTRYFDGAMAINSQGTPFTVSACGDSYGPVSSWNNGPSHFALTRGSTAAGSLQEYNGANGTSLLYLESNWNGANLNNLDRFKWPDIVVTGNNANTKGYISYYDSSLKVIKFRYFETDGSKVAANYDPYTAGYAPQAINQNNTSAIKRQSTEGTVRNDLTSNQGYMVIAGANENSQYSSVGVTSSGAAVVAWYDATNGELKMKYNTKPAESYSGYQTITDPPSSGTISFNIAVDGTTAKPVSFTYSYVTGVTGRTSTRNVHELAYRLNEILSNGYGAYAEVDPESTDQNIVVRSMQTGEDSSILITNFTSTGTNKGIVGTAVAGAGQPWTLVTIDEESAGQFVSMKTDSKGGIHFAYYDTSNGDLKYAYMSSVSATPKVVTVDGYQQVGQYVDLALKETTTNSVTSVTPYISYYSMSNADTKRSAKVAKLVTPVKYTTTGDTVTANTTSIPEGSEDELFTGNWEAMHIPTYGIPVQYRVNIGVTSNGNVYISYLADRTIEYVKVE